MLKYSLDSSCSQTFFFSAIPKDLDNVERNAHPDAKPDLTSSSASDDDDEREDSDCGYGNGLDHGDVSDEGSSGRKKRKRKTRPGMYMRQRAPLEFDPDRPDL